MTSKTIYEHHIQFIPKNADAHTTPTIKLVTFCSKNTSKDKVKKEAYNEAERQNIIDSYALRNHWEIFNMEVDFKNKPWGGWRDLCNKILSIDGVRDVKEIRNELYISSDPNKIKKIKQEIDNYHSGLNPQKSEKNIVKIKTRPVYK